jgi:hypothetical protein
VYSDVVADPPEQVVLNAVEFARQHAVDLIIGLGGGSSMDVAKLIAVLAGSEQALGQIYGIGNVTGKRLPLVQVPTTAGTGSEVTNIAIVTTGETTKMGVVAPQLYADLAILDAELTLGLPPMVTAATGIDAMVHAIEAYHQQAQEESDVGHAGAPGVVAAVGKPAESVRKRRRPAGAPGHAAGRLFCGAGVFEFAGGGRACAGVSDRRDFPCRRTACRTRWCCRMCCVQHAGGDGTLCRDCRHRRAACRGQRGSARRGLDCCDAANRQDDGDRNDAAAGRDHEADLDRLADDAMLQTRLLGNNPREMTREHARAIYAAAL